jgi:hypothetical protein
MGAGMLSPAPRLGAQDAGMLQKLQEIKASSTANKQALARYTWTEIQTISLKGQVRKTQTFQVVVGAGGEQEKTELNPMPEAAPSGGRFKQRIVAKKKEEFQEYGEQIAALAKQYTPPEAALLQKAYESGNILAQPAPGGTLSLIIKNYLKPGDSMTLTFNRQTKAMESLRVATYLSAPSDAVTVAVTFAKIPNGPNHVATIQVDGISKQLGVNMQNSNYRPKL